MRFQGTITNSFFSNIYIKLEILNDGTKDGTLTEQGETLVQGSTHSSSSIFFLFP